MISIDEMKRYFGRKRYYSIRNEGLQEWVEKTKEKRDAVRFHVRQFMEQVYRRDMRLLDEDQVGGRRE